MDPSKYSPKLRALMALGGAHYLAGALRATADEAARAAYYAAKEGKEPVDVAVAARAAVSKSLTGAIKNCMDEARGCNDDNPIEGTG